MTTSYQYDDTPSTRPDPSSFGPLPESDYDFLVIDNDYADSIKPTLNKNQRWVLNLKLSVGPNKTHIFYSPWAGLDKNGAKHDQIGEFLRAIGLAPAPGQEPAWDKVVGKKGKVHLTVEKETYQQSKLFGKDVNRVAYVLAPKDVKASAPAATNAPVKRHAFDPDLDAAPDDIPF